LVWAWTWLRRRLRGSHPIAPEHPCHAEGREFESLHPLSGKPRERGCFSVLVVPFDGAARTALFGADVLATIELSFVAD
jgi:hypothetical protein